ncbi:uncharacterized protein UTRI_00603_B [Ustilago trichophora]|uniref:Uncharacterized protein n=1 Tax=Ustilago trichophora TaxID=86804 RepID=A0A5C3DRL0_9BASI|nr:uncharacterized protein UTRI_00603_B [Ustilago trichophora]
MASNLAKATFIGLNALRLVSLVVIILVFTTLIMGLIEDIRDYHNDANMDEARTDDCAYVPGTSIPMQTWGIFWVEFHRALLLLGVIALFFAELSWFGIPRLERAAQVWFPILSRTRGLAALGCVHVVIATSILSHYLDEFPLVVSWMLFVIGLCYLCMGVAFHSHPLKDGRSLFSQKRKQFVKGHGQDHVYRTFGREKDYGATNSTDKPSLVLQKLFKRKGKATRSQAVSINETFPSLEADSHRQVLAERARRAQHQRKRSSVAVDMSTVDPDRSSITRDFVWNATAGVVHEREDTRYQHEDSSWEMRHVNTQRRDSEVSQQSCSAASVASSTVRIGGYTSKEAALARERAKRRRAAASAASSSERRYPPPAKSTGQSAKAVKLKNVKRRSMAFVNTARNRLSAGTASALAARRRVSPANVRGIPNAETDVVVEYIDDEASAPPVPPLPAYHQAARAPEHEVELPVASRFARGHVV